MKPLPPQSDDQSFQWLYDQLKLLAGRVERVEGKCEQAIRSERPPPYLLFPTRREFDELRDRVDQLESTPKPEES